MNRSLFKIPLPVSFNLLREKAKINPLIVNYHIVSDKRVPYVKELYNYRNIKKFCEDLDFFVANFHPIGLPEFLDCIKQNRKPPDKSILITIDDGFKEVYEYIAPLMIERKLTATLFLNSSFVDNKQFGSDQKKSLLIENIKNCSATVQIGHIIDELKLQHLFKKDLPDSIRNISYYKGDILDKIAEMLGYDFKAALKLYSPFLTSNQIAELLDSGFTIGGHSIDHPNFAELSVMDQVIQAKTSIDFLTEKFALKYKVFAFPYWDGGVSKSFFDAINGQIDATFGTQGLMIDSIQNNFQRMSVEKYPQSAERIIKANYMRKIIYHALSKDMVPRT